MNLLGRWGADPCRHACKSPLRPPPRLVCVTLCVQGAPRLMNPPPSTPGKGRREGHGFSPRCLDAANARQGASTRKAWFRRPGNRVPRQTISPQAPPRQPPHTAGESTQAHLAHAYPCTADYDKHEPLKCNSNSHHTPHCTQRTPRPNNAADHARSSSFRTPPHHAKGAGRPKKIALIKGRQESRLLLRAVRAQEP